MCNNYLNHAASCRFHLVRFCSVKSVLKIYLIYFSVRLRSSSFLRFLLSLSRDDHG